MKVILLEDVKALGKKGQVVEVSDGYAKNFLLKGKLAVEANAQNMNVLKTQEGSKMFNINIKNRTPVQNFKKKNMKHGKQKGTLMQIVRVIKLHTVS